MDPDTSQVQNRNRFARNDWLLALVVSCCIGIGIGGVTGMYLGPILSDPRSRILWENSDGAEVPNQFVYLIFSKKDALTVICLPDRAILISAEELVGDHGMVRADDYEYSGLTVSREKLTLDHTEVDAIHQIAWLNGTLRTWGGKTDIAAVSFSILDDVSGMRYRLSIQHKNHTTENFEYRVDDEIPTPIRWSVRRGGLN